MIKRMRKADKAKHDQLLDALAFARQVVFGGEWNVPFSKCYDMSPPSVQAAYDAAYRDLLEFESDMVAQGRAYRSYGGMIYSY